MENIIEVVSNIFLIVLFVVCISSSMFAIKLIDHEEKKGSYELK